MYIRGAGCALHKTRPKRAKRYEAKLSNPEKYADNILGYVHQRESYARYDAEGCSLPADFDEE